MARKVLLVLLVALVVVDVSWTAAVDHRASTAEDRLDRVERDQRVLGVYYGMNESLSRHTSANATLYAYERGPGAVRTVSVRVVSVPADGVYVDVSEVAHRLATQRSATRAWTVATSSDPQPAHRGALVSIDAPEEWDAVGGGSAALSLAAAFAATNPCVTANGSAAATGGLDEDGRVRRVEHVEEKARAAADRGVDVFVVPTGQAVEVSGVSVVEAETFRNASGHLLDTDEQCLAER